jgi:RND family efflux transporter MFP subunit
MTRSLLTYSYVSRFYILATLLIFSAVLSACSEEQKAEKKDEGRPVLVQAARTSPRVAERTFVATIRPRIETDLSFRVGGKVAQRLIQVGDVIKAGQLLATLDETDLRLQREQAEAEVRAATASVIQADADLKRITTLRAEGWSAAANLDRQRAISEEAQGRLSRAQRTLSLATNALSYASLSSDVGGVVTLAAIEPGQVVNSGQTAIRVAQLDEKEAVIAVPETLVEWVKSGEARVSLWSAPDRQYEALLREMSPAADMVTRTYQARFSLKNAGDEVKIGMTATVTLAEPARAHIFRVPLSALFNQGGGSAVWVVDAQGGLTLKPVSVTAYESREVLISDGLIDGDQVVVMGVHKLDQSQKVRPIQKLDF